VIREALLGNLTGTSSVTLPSQQTLVDDFAPELACFAVAFGPVTSQALRSARRLPQD
jgi:hypothetical protein